MSNVYHVMVSVDVEDEAKSPSHEEKTFNNDHLYENVCRRVVGKCSFLLFAVQPAIPGENTLQMYPNVS